MADRLRDKVALITGAGSGIGPATAVLFAQEGAKIALADLRSADLDTVEGVRVNALCPGFVFTNLTKALTDQPESRRFLEEKHPMGRLGQADEIARAALFLASDDASRS
jgi:NAD(P)-dependent dehydrogenase (short-subunit alcohol dehydrogenase family)